MSGAEGAPAPGAPASARLCDAVCLAFALWTLCAHAVVAAGGSLRVLAGVFAAAGVAVLALRRARGAGAGGAAPADPPMGSAPPPSPAPALRLAGLALAGAATLAFHFYGGTVGLWIAGVALLAAAAAWLLPSAPAWETPRRGRGLEAGLWLLGASCALITLVCHRPDIDDAFYVNLATSAAAHPGAPLLAGDTLHGAAELPLLLPVYRLHSYELWNGALAWATGRPALEIFHWISASLAALLVPMAHARLLRQLTPREWLAATAALVFVLLAAGTPHRWYGNFAFVRMWQGKGIFLFVFLPLVQAYAIEWARRPTPGSWLRLAAAQVAALGCTSSALWAAPVSAALALATALRPTPRELARLAWGLGASLYPLAAGALMLESMASGVHAPSLGNKNWTPGYQLEGALAETLGDDRLLAAGLFALLGSWACTGSALARRFALVFPLALLLVLLNPFAARWVVGHVTGGSYWRCMWALPLPLLMALVLIAPLELGTRAGRRARGAALSVALAAAFALGVPEWSSLSRQNAGGGELPLRLGWPGLKVPEDSFAWARSFAESVPTDATVLAPLDVSVWLPTLPEPPRPLLVRPSYLRIHREALGLRDVGTREALTLFAGGERVGPGEAQLFAEALERYALQGVLLRAGPQSAVARRILRERGFRPGARSLAAEIWLREAPATPAGS